MNRQQLEQYIYQTYHVKPDYPWKRSPKDAVFRHAENRKWFALVMSVGRDKLGMPQTGQIDIMNVKCDPALIGSLLGESGFFPAYHMNKENWVTTALDDSASDEKIRMLLDMSYTATAEKIQSKRTGGENR